MQKLKFLFSGRSPKNMVKYSLFKGTPDADIASELALNAKKNGDCQAITLTKEGMKSMNNIFAACLLVSGVLASYFALNFC